MDTGNVLDRDYVMVGTPFDSLRRIDVAWVCLIVAIGAYVAPTPPGKNDYGPWFSYDRRAHLGAEYNSIARSIREGQGFSNPFEVETGPTAWMPPVLPYTLAGLYWLANDDKTIVKWLVIQSQCLVLCMSGLLVINLSRRLRVLALGYATFLIGLAANFRELFQTTHDVWLVMLGVNLLWIGLVRWWTTQPSGIWAGVWGIFGGVLALCSPMIGATWALLTFWRWAPFLRTNLGGNASWKPLLIAAFLSMLVVTPWMIRCRVTMGKWVPIKSNGMYELWQSQCLDDDGVWDAMLAAKHPWENGSDERQSYRELGEIEFIALRGQEAVADIRANPTKYLQRVGHRLAAASLWYVPFVPMERIQPGVVWSKRAVYCIPMLSVIVILVSQKLRGQSLRSQAMPALAAVSIIVVSLLPYVLVNFYARYSAPFLALKMILVVYAGHELFRARSNCEQRSLVESTSPPNEGSDRNSA